MTEQEIQELKNAPTEPPPPMNAAPVVREKAQRPIFDRVMAHALNMAVQVGALKAENAVLKAALQKATAAREAALIAAGAKSGEEIVELKKQLAAKDAELTRIPRMRLADFVCVLTHIQKSPIEAIKLLRGFTDCGLKEAKDAIEIVRIPNVSVG